MRSDLPEAKKQGTAMREYAAVSRLELPRAFEQIRRLACCRYLWAERLPVAAAVLNWVKLRVEI